MISSLLKRGVIAMFPALSINVNAPTTQTAMIINGSFNVSHRTIQDKLKINGEAKLGVGTVVQDAMTVNGTLHADGTTFQSELIANGPTRLHQCRLQDTAHFSGTVNAIGSHFFKDIKLRAHKSTFKNCNLNTMTVQEIPFITKQVIHLQQGSVMEGDVTFESGNGEVVLDESSRMDGMVHGGTKLTR